MAAFDYRQAEPLQKGLACQAPTMTSLKTA
jgi:hypothetical protein